MYLFTICSLIVTLAVAAFSAIYAIKAYGQQKVDRLLTDTGECANRLRRLPSSSALRTASGACAFVSKWLGRAWELAFLTVLAFLLLITFWLMQDVCSSEWSGSGEPFDLPTDRVLFYQSWLVIIFRVDCWAVVAAIAASVLVKLINMLTSWLERVALEQQDLTLQNIHGLGFVPPTRLGDPEGPGEAQENSPPF